MAEKPDMFMAMGNTAEVVARRYQVTRDAQDEYALQSQQRYAGPRRPATSPTRSRRWTCNGRRSSTKRPRPPRSSTGTVDRDECNRPSTTLEGLTSLGPAFEEGGSVTAGNASQLSDGAAMALLMTEEACSSSAGAHGLLPRLHRGRV